MGRPSLPESTPHDGVSEANHEQAPASLKGEASPFRALLTRLLAVPHDEIVEQEQRWKAGRKNVPR